MMLARDHMMLALDQALQRGNASLDPRLGFLDRRAPVSSRWFDVDGRLHVKAAPISKVGVSVYFGSEIPGNVKLGLDPDREYRMFRSPEELRKAAPTFRGVPLLSEHVAFDEPHRPELVVGCVGSDAHFDGEFLRATVVVWAQRAIDGILNGTKRELSAGYVRHELRSMTPGIFRGQRFNGKMGPLEAHHVALVDEGKAGSDCGL